MAAAASSEPTRAQCSRVSVTPVSALLSLCPSGNVSCTQPPTLRPTMQVITPPADDERLLMSILGDIYTCRQRVW